MPARKPPTERQRRLGAELRKMREQAGLSLTDAAKRHQVDKTAISNTESARFGVSPDRVRVWAANYSCPDTAYVDALAEVAGERGKQWWDEYRGTMTASALDLADMEHHARALRSAQLMHVPGLLQTEDYARAVFKEAVPTPVPEVIDRCIAFRLQRASVLDTPHAPACTFLIHEAALRMRFGEPTVMRAQLDHLAQQSERAGVSVRVVPFSAGGFPNVGSSTLYACGPVWQLDMVQSDNPMGSTFLHAEAHLSNYREALDRMEGLACGPSRSRDILREASQRL
ncbi:Scr1 family TA system antitoxin-like transcriptional regulator [Streptomyces oceani]|uniref:DNA-binding protein n=1 Tax=Streptomyces oceani TaxID=1075402 RepID=A0A1E7JXG9_9ACTN|nr:Scr1 family TA system antitoxin-like transcriptional regulator [Streptomyces oceani]OEU96370.1 DNA-binding protein [Streptomyces oceani]